MKSKKISYTVAILAATFLTFGSIATAVDNIDNEEQTVTEIKADDIKPATVQELKIIDNKALMEADNNETNASATTKQEESEKVTNEENKTTEAENKDLPVLEDIQLPTIEKEAVNHKPVKIEVSSQRIPAGTVLPVQLDSMISSLTSNIGDQFNATLTADVIIGDKIILPAGSVLRGTVGNVKKSNLCFKEAKVMLIFDHIVTPVGKQIPIYTYLQSDESVNYEGYIVGGTSYGKAFKEDASKGRDILVKSTTFGVDKGLEYLKGVPVVLTAPVCAIGGALGSGGYIVGKSVYNIFVKGGDVNLNKGTVLNITLSKALDVPLN